MSINAWNAAGALSVYAGSRMMKVRASRRVYAANVAVAKWNGLCFRAWRCKPPMVLPPLPAAIQVALDAAVDIPVRDAIPSIMNELEPWNV